MTRSFHQIACESETLATSLDSGNEATALLIVSGGNEIRAGAHGGMAQLARRIAEQGFPVLRYDRRGIGESSGENREFPGSADEIAAAARFLRQQQPQVSKIIAFGNCDAATALALFGPDAGIDGYVLANPWVIETSDKRDSEKSLPSSAAIRSRYWDRIKNPRTIIDLLSGKIDFRKLLKGLMQASKVEENSALSIRLRNALSRLDRDSQILLAKRDTTARAFLATWNSPDFATLRASTGITLETLDSASHSFADQAAKDWLAGKLIEALRQA
ncbi:hydrolase 1, exosortase A system-associated [uncultured Parasphingorhabdus sp.]|uniref:hydrolase 1, exosortase A system-associated n=1 Tax=uncultured Parasphingorhabdus sp. TaxID=2709694 RepID=UPI0030D6E3BB|tara:strand:- start:16950 stop:17771 length:822 start_codon:yes stop_codon:yes gene_type:complete